MKKAISILIGCTSIAMGVNLFLVPLDLLEGGALGISLILYHLYRIDVGFAFLIISIPIFLLAWLLYRPFFYNGIHGMLCSSLLIDVLYPLRKISMELEIPAFLGAIGAGICIGMGVGYMLRQEVSIGGTDLLAQMVAKRIGVNTATVIFSFDLIVIIIGSFLLPSVHFVLSFVTIFTIGLTATRVLTKQRAHPKIIVVSQEMT